MGVSLSRRLTPDLTALKHMNASREYLHGPDDDGQHVTANSLRCLRCNPEVVPVAAQMGSLSV